MTIRKILLIAAAFIGLAHAQTKVPPQLINGAGSTAGQAIVSTGPTTSPGWATVTAGGLTPIGANTVYGNFTGSSASPVANAVPSCSTANSALKYTTSAGLSCGTTFALTSGNLSQFAATTSAQLLSVLSDETGSGAAVFGTSPTIASPTISGTVAGAHSYSGAVTFTSAITPSTTAGIVGTTAANNANAGSVGEVLSNAVTGTSLTTNIIANCASVSLTAGDWDVQGTVSFSPAGTTTVSQISAGISTTSASFSAANTGATTFLVVGFTTGQPQVIASPTYRINVNATTTAYLVTQAQFGVSTMTCSGFITARRVR